jgi:hypothetical protein
MTALNTALSDIQARRLFFDQPILPGKWAISIAP